MTLTLCNPLELVLGIVENRTQAGRMTTYEEYVREVRGELPPVVPFEMRPYVDHALSLLVSNGYLTRHHVAHGTLSYSPTREWGNRELLLSQFRSPRPVVRAWRIRAAAARREEKQRAKEAKLRAKLEQREREREAKRQERIARCGFTATGRLRRQPLVRGAEATT